MIKFTLHTTETAPKDTLPLFEKSRKDFGMIPNLHAVMGEAPSILEAYQAVHELFMKTSLSAEEQTVVWQTINVENECHYCVPAHTAVAHMMGVEEMLSNALRDGKALPEKLETLRNFTLKILRQKGRLSESDVETFLAAGFTKQNIFEVILGVSQKTMSNYVNHIADTPIDKGFQKFAWSPVNT
jgi:alkylhydroperoxidase family enzyme|tara:strand:+ start:204245 stop:204799 length:555 start_codon:yes stop_codon:yes gene_type:complete